MDDGKEQKEFEKTMDEEMQKSYHNIIRQMITNENEIRNQRTNWFLVIQGFLVAGCCELYANKCLCQIYCLILIISVIGIVTSLSFWHAAWRSEKSIEMALACWNRFIKRNKKDFDDFPPIILLTTNIINRRKVKLSNRKSYDKDVLRELELFREIYISKRNSSQHKSQYEKCKSHVKICRDRLVNHFDFILPFKAMPAIFILVWLVVFLFCVITMN